MRPGVVDTFGGFGGVFVMPDDGIYRVCIRTFEKEETVLATFSGGRDPAKRAIRYCRRVRAVISGTRAAKGALS